MPPALRSSCYRCALKGQVTAPYSCQLMQATQTSTCRVTVWTASDVGAWAGLGLISGSGGSLLKANSDIREQLSEAEMASPCAFPQLR